MKFSRFERILILQCRGLGDALISTSIINSIHKTWHHVKIDIWASPEVATLFQQNPAVNHCYIQSLPIIRRYKFTWGAVARLLTAIRRLRARRYDLCMNLVGDFRENLLTSLVGAKSTWAIAWDAEHPFRRLIRPGLSWLIDYNEYITRETVNVYAVYKLVAKNLGCRDASAHEVGRSDTASAQIEAVGKKVGIHPLAGQACREWPFDSWNALIEGILQLGFDVIVFGEASRRDFLENAFTEWRQEPRVVIETHKLTEFMNRLAGMVAFVGLDSFAIHAAHMLGVPSVMINGANNPACWAPPGTQVLGDGGGCRAYPCYNSPKCIGTEGEYVCIREIKVSEVLAALKVKLAVAHLSRSQLPERVP